MVVFDAQEEVAYWVYIQAYFKNIGRFNLALIGETTTIHFRKTDLVDTSAMRLFARYKANILRRRPEIVHYDVLDTYIRTDGGVTPIAGLSAYSLEGTAARLRES